MSTQYHVYANGGTGGPVNEGTPIATTAGLTYTPAALALGSDWTFLVRAYDTVSGLEEKNRQAMCRIHVDAAGLDLAARPAAPVGLAADARATGGCLVRWGYMTVGPGPLPVGFHVYLTQGASPNYGAAPAATVLFSSSPGGLSAPFSAYLTGLSDGFSYIVGVRAYNLAGEEQNRATVTVVGASSPPGNVEALAGMPA